MIGRAPIYARDGWPPSYIIWQGSSKHGGSGGAPPVGRQRAPATFLVVPARAPREAAPDDEPVAAGGEHYPAPALQLRRRRHQGRGEQGP